jgi:uncharacterized DUF497 family protein
VEFRWNRWNIDHIGEHGVVIAEAEYVVEHATNPYPRYEGNGKFLVRGQTAAGDYLQVVFVLSPEDVVFIIHARLLTEREKRNYRRKRAP